MGGRRLNSCEKTKGAGPRCRGLFGRAQPSLYAVVSPSPGALCSVLPGEALPILHPAVPRLLSVVAFVSTGQSTSLHVTESMSLEAKLSTYPGFSGYVKCRDVEQDLGSGKKGCRQTPYSCCSFPTLSPRPSHGLGALRSKQRAYPGRVPAFVKHANVNEDNGFYFLTGGSAFSLRSELGGDVWDEPVVRLSKR